MIPVLDFLKPTEPLFLIDKKSKTDESCIPYPDSNPELYKLLCTTIMFEYLFVIDNVHYPLRSFMRNSFYQ